MPSRRHAELQMSLTSVEEPETGLWCDSCALPSIVAADFLMTVNGRPYSVLRVVGCADHGKVTYG